MSNQGPVELKALMATLSLSKNWISDSAWQYYAKNYNQLKEDDRERSQSISKVMRDNKQWCYKKEHITQKALQTGFSEETWEPAPLHGLNLL
jgi:hypothetical protein